MSSSAVSRFTRKLISSRQCSCPVKIRSLCISALRQDLKLPSTWKPKSETERRILSGLQAIQSDPSPSSSSASDNLQKIVRIADALLPTPTIEGQGKNIVDWIFVKSQVLDEDPNTVLIDVREPAEVSLGSIPSAHSIPLSEFASAFDLAPQDFKDKYQFHHPLFNPTDSQTSSPQNLVLFCRSGARSQSAMNHLQEKNERFKTGLNIYNYKGSWIDWVNKEEIFRKEIERIQDEDA